MKIQILTASALLLCAFHLVADVFYVPEKYDPVTKQRSFNQEAIDKLIKVAGVDPQLEVHMPSPQGDTHKVIFGRLLGVVTGEPYGPPELGMTMDSINVQFLTKDGQLIGEPALMSLADLQIIPHRSSIDTFWDLERYYGSISSSFDADLGSEIFDMVLMGILDPTGEMGLNTLQVAIELPDDFKHGWLTHYAYFGHNESARMKDPYALDSMNAFSDTLLAPKFTDYSYSLIEQLAADIRYNIYEPGLRPHVLKLIGHLYRLKQIDPGKVSDPKLVERAKRLHQLADNLEWSLQMMLHGSSEYKFQNNAFFGQPLSPQDRALAALAVIEANESVFQTYTQRLLESLLNAGLVATTSTPINVPHPECAEQAMDAYFNLLKNPTMTGDADMDDRLRTALAIRRNFALRGLIPGAINDDAAFTARTREVFRSIGYGATADVKMIIDGLDNTISQDYQATDIFETPGFMTINMPTFNEQVSPLGGGFGSSRDPVEEAPSVLSFSQGSLSDEAFLLHALGILKEIAFNLPPDAVGRERKAGLVETWRQQQLNAFEEWPEKQVQFPDGSPPKLPEKCRYLQRLLQEGWEPAGPAVEG
ncbi:MAG: hypothetical protein ACSHX8_14200 [Opitutaceae bacterium]